MVVIYVAVLGSEVCVQASVISGIHQDVWTQINVSYQVHTWCPTSAEVIEAAPQVTYVFHPCQHPRVRGQHYYCRNITSGQA